MFGWLFGKKKPKPKKIDERLLYKHDDLAAEFWAMTWQDQLSVMRFLEVREPVNTLSYARPLSTIMTRAENIKLTKNPMTLDQFLAELKRLHDADRITTLEGVFQQIFRDLKEAREYVAVLQDIHYKFR